MKQLITYKIICQNQIVLKKNHNIFYFEFLYIMTFHYIF